MFAWTTYMFGAHNTKSRMFKMFFRPWMSLFVVRGGHLLLGGDHKKEEERGDIAVIK